MMTQPNTHLTNVTIARIGGVYQHAGENIAGASTGIVPSPLNGSEEAHTLLGQESEAVSGDDHKPG